MFLSRMNIKSFKDETGKRIVKIDFNTIKVTELFSDKHFKSCVSSEVITVTKKDHLSFHLTKMDCGGTIFVYKYLDTKKEKSEEERHFQEEQRRLLEALLKKKKQNDENNELNK